MSSPKFALVVWENGKKSVERYSKIAEGVAAPNQRVTIKYGKKNSRWPAKVLEVGKKLIQYVSCIAPIEIHFKGMMKEY